MYVYGLFFVEVKFFCEILVIVDIVILVDGSWSIGRFNFRFVRNFLENLVIAFNVGLEKIRIGKIFGLLKLVIIENFWADFL